MAARLHGKITHMEVGRVFVDTNQYLAGGSIGTTVF